MSVTVTTYDNRTFEISEEAAMRVGEAMAENWQHVHIAELNITLAINDIRRLDTTASSGLPSGKSKFRVPKNHDTVVLDENHQVVRTYKLDGYYSDEAMAVRREANKAKYASGAQVRSKYDLPEAVNQGDAP